MPHELQRPGSADIISLALVLIACGRIDRVATSWTRRTRVFARYWVATCDPLRKNKPRRILNDTVNVVRISTVVLTKNINIKLKLRRNDSYKSGRTVDERGSSNTLPGHAIDVIEPGRRSRERKICVLVHIPPITAVRAMVSVVKREISYYGFVKVSVNGHCSPLGSILRRLDLGRKSGRVRIAIAPSTVIDPLRGCLRLHQMRKNSAKNNKKKFEKRRN